MAPPIPDDLEWLTTVLWPDERIVVTRATSPAPGWLRVARFRIAPNVERPRLLVPDQRGSGDAFAVLNDAMTQPARLRKRLAGVLYDLGPGRWLFRDRLGVDVPADVPQDDLVDLLLDRHLAAVLGWPRVLASVTFGAPRPNRKPVLQLAPAGRPIAAFAKVAWNPLTARLVRNETAVLAWLAERGGRTFVAPRRIHDGRWHGREILVTVALPGKLVRRGPLRAWPRPDLTREIAALDGAPTPMPITASPMWDDLLTRIRALEPTRPLDGILEELEPVFTVIETPVGWWHGDLGPWNMTRLDDGRVALWDWERSRGGVPLGMDVAHFAFQVALKRVGGRGAVACRSALEELGAYLPDLGLRPAVGPAVLALYLTELLGRYEEAVAGAILPTDHAGRRAVLDALEELRGALR